MEMNRFLNNRYAVMRHAKDVEEKGLTVIVADSVAICSRVSRELSGRIKGMRVIIFHSPQIRARFTAEIMRNELLANGVNVESVSELPWLDCEKDTVTNQNIETVLPDDDRSFILFISHKPDVAMFMGKDKYGLEPTNCTLYSEDFTIVGH
jgi:hypothetical protein